MGVKGKSAGDGDGLDVDAAVVAMRFKELLAWCESAKNVSELRYRLSGLEHALVRADPGAVSPEQRARAEKLGVSQALFDGLLGEVPSHAVRVPLVCEPSGEGLLRLMHVANDPTVHGAYAIAFDHTARRAIADAISLAVERAKVPWEHARYFFTTTAPEALHCPGLDVPVRGPSLGAAAFVSAFSLYTGRPVRHGLVVTGRLVGSKVRDVGRLGAKLGAVAAARADVARVIVPTVSLADAKRDFKHSEHGIEVIGVSTIDELIDAALEVAPPSRIHVRHRVAEVRREFEGGWRGFRWYTLRDRVERLAAEVPEARADLKVEAMSMLGAIQGHLGSPKESLAVLEEAVRFAASDAVREAIPDLPLAHLYQHLAITRTKLVRFSEARAAATSAVRVSKRGRLRDEWYKSLGCAGLVELGANRSGAAVTAFEAALALVHAYTPESCARSHAYLIQALGLAGDTARIAQEFTTACAHMRDHHDAADTSHTEAWLRISYGGALVACGKLDDASRALDVACVREAIANAPLPGLLARRHLGIALAGGPRRRDGYALLAPSPIAHPLLTGGLLFTAQVNVLCEARARLQHGDWDRDIEGRALAELDRFPGYLETTPIERARRSAVETVARGSQDGRRALAALDRLVCLCERIA